MKVRIPIDKFTENIYPWQIQFMSAFDLRLARFFMLEIHRRARKTSTAINLLIRECCKNPNSVYFYAGPTFAQAKDIVWLDPNMLFSYLPDKKDFGWEKNESELYIKFENGTYLHIIGGDNPDRLRGLDFKGGVIDEWALMKESIWTEIIFPMMAQDPERWMCFLYTPKGYNHATEMFDRAACIEEGGTLPDNGPAEKMRSDWYVMRLVASKTGIISAEQLEIAKREMTRAMYEQELECARVTDEERTLVTSAMLEALKTIKIVEPHTRKIISCDPALTGDKCVARAMINCKTVKRIEMYYRDTMKIVGDLIILSNETGINNFIIDTCNLGKTIADRLSEIGKNKKLNYDIQYFNSAEKASDPQRFANIKAEMWWYIKEQVDAMRIPYPDEPVLLKQIPAASRYDTVSSDGKIRMQLKGKVRKQLGCSPDDAESWGYGVWGTQFVEPEVEIQPDRVRRRNRYGKTSAMAL